MLLPDPLRPASDDAALELAVLQGQVDAVPLPGGLPGWQSLAAAEYARAVRALAGDLAAAAAALGAARSAT